MQTNYDELARLKMAEYEAYANARRLQRLAREASRSRSATFGIAPRRWLADARYLALPIAAGVTVAVVVFVR